MCIHTGSPTTLFGVSEEPAWEPPEGSWASSAARRRNMQAIRSRDTKPEKIIRRLVHAKGLRYRVAARPVPELRRTADLVFRPTKVAVFIDGCYWHGCPEHYVPPRTNSGYWSEKVLRNVERDRDTDRKLREAGWLVLRFWEHEPSDSCAQKITDIVAARRTARPGP
ncbi:very short patch repair endonuclease [Streptomyces sp. b94]|uniref:very short patch repair endonuclease n=1 Tax=Streptomyces sp. b94 TaxID=1827634 RepID=UPI001B36341D|nr:very short patch repair endonuclease [Streptomyces sp. b94]MBQ1096994.1 very short patch repair endonuclease [Streptomyces sp. b94]